MEFHCKVIINAPCDQVFKVINNSELFPQFDPNCLKIEGDIRLGNIIKVYSRLRPERGFKVRVSTLIKNQEMVWESALPFHLFKGVRTFRVFAKDDHTTEFTMVEVFSGHLLSFFKNKIPDMNSEFNQFARGLKKYIESR